MSRERPHKSAVKRFIRKHQLPSWLQLPLEALLTHRVDIEIKRWLGRELYREDPQK